MTWQSGPATADGRVLVRDPASHSPHRRRWHAVPAHVLPRLGLPLPPGHLPPRQRQALDAVRAFAAVHGRQPTAAELGRLLAPPIRQQSAQKLLDRLRLAGWLSGAGRGPTAAEAENRRLRAVVGEAAAFLRGVELANGQRAERDIIYARLVAEFCTEV